MQPLILFDNISLTYRTGEEIFWDLNLRFNPGAFYFLTGPSGSGKTSLLKLIYMDVMPTQGRVSVLGYDSRTISQRQIPYVRQKIGMVFQECYMLNHLSLIENVALPLKIRGVGKQQALQNALEMLKWVGLERYVHNRPNVLSGGQKQRAAIARAVIGRPSFILADEPTGNVDRENAERILYLFEALHKRGTTIVFATHDRSLANAYPYPELLIKDHKIQLNERTVKQYPGFSSKRVTEPSPSTILRRNVIIGGQGESEV